MKALREKEGDMKEFVRKRPRRVNADWVPESSSIRTSSKGKPDQSSEQAGRKKNGLALNRRKNDSSNTLDTEQGAKEVKHQRDVWPRGEVVRRVAKVRESANRQGGGYKKKGIKERAAGKTIPREDLSGRSRTSGKPKTLPILPGGKRSTSRSGVFPGKNALRGSEH